MGSFGRKEMRHKFPPPNLARRALKRSGCEQNEGISQNLWTGMQWREASGADEENQDFRGRTRRFEWRIFARPISHFVFSCGWVVWLAAINQPMWDPTNLGNYLKIKNTWTDTFSLPPQNQTLPNSTSHPNPWKLHQPGKQTIPDYLKLRLRDNTVSRK